MHFSKIILYLFLSCDILGIVLDQLAPANSTFQRKWEKRAWMAHLPTKGKRVARTRQPQKKEILMINSINLQYWMLSKEQE
jgi:hypothetical protein